MTNTEKKVNEITCYDCGKKQSELFMLFYDDRYYCLDCWLNHGDNQLLIDYSYKQPPKFCKMSFEKNPLFMGIELEVEADDEDEDYDEEYDEEYSENSSDYLQNYAYRVMKQYPCWIKYDGSLNNNGMEIVTHPFTNKYHKRVFNWKKLLEKLKQDGFTSHDNNRCGLHIHLSKSWFKKEDYLKFNIFFDKNYSPMKRFSKRTRTNYCGKIGNNQTKLIIRNKKEMRLDDFYDHYKSIYFGNYKTIEIRIYRGTLNIKHFYNILDITEALAYFIKSYSLTFFITASKKLLWYTFLSFMKQSKRYNKILKALDKEKLTFCNLNNIPRKGEILKDTLEIKDLTSLMGNADIAKYFKEKQLDKLRYYFDTFEDYIIHNRNEVYNTKDNHIIPLHFEKIIMENKVYNARTRKIIIDSFLDWGFIVKMQNGEITARINSKVDLAVKLGIDVEKINREIGSRENREIRNYERVNRNIFTDIHSNSLYSIQRKYANIRDRKVEKLTIEKLAKRKNRDLKFIFRQQN